MTTCARHYFRGGEFLRDLRILAPRTSAPCTAPTVRAALYAEMVFGNIPNGCASSDDAAAQILRCARQGADRRGYFAATRDGR